jgi:hypothetical protein
VAWSVPKTWTVGEFVTAAMMNVYVRDNMNFLHDQFGQWLPMPFDAGNFGTDGPQWIVASGNVQQNQFQLFNGVLVLWSFSVGGTRLVAPCTYLYIRSPVAGGLHPFRTTEQIDRTAYVDSFPAPAIECLCGPLSIDIFRIWRIDGLQFTAGTALGVYFNVFMRIG